MIKGFRDKYAERIWHGEGVRQFAPDLQRVARRKPRMLNNTRVLDDLRVPPGNRLEALRGDRTGQHSIRIDDQWRICFVRHDGDVLDVEIVDYQ